MNVLWAVPQWLLCIWCIYEVDAFRMKNMFASFLLASSLNVPPCSSLSKLENDNTYTMPATVRVSDNNIYFYGSITKESCQELTEALITLDKTSKTVSENLQITPLPIHLHIQSEGGSLMNTFYVVDLINQLDTPIYTYVDGYVASAGSLISVAGKKRFMTKNSFIMIHQLSSSLSQGKFNDFDDNMDNLNKLMDTLRAIYLEKTKLHLDDLNNILEHDLWMNSKESLEYGLVDDVI